MPCFQLEEHGVLSFSFQYPWKVDSKPEHQRESLCQRSNKENNACKELSIIDPFPGIPIPSSHQIPLNYQKNRFFVYLLLFNAPDSLQFTMDPMKSALNLFRRLPPEEVESTFRSIALLREDLSSELLQHLEFPLTKGYDEESKKEFILSDFNSNGESYR